MVLEFSLTSSQLEGFWLAWATAFSLHYVLLLLAIVYGWLKLHRLPPVADVERAVGVSVLKPLSGLDRAIEDNLRSWFQIDYPKFELIFCVSNADDPVVGLVERLRKEYDSAVTSKLVIQPGPQDISNPKVRNLIGGYDVADPSYPLVMISDCNVRASPLTLRDLTAHLSDNVGLVHQLPFVSDRPGFAALVEMIYFGMTLVNGMSCLVRKEIIDANGGLQSCGNHLAEDLLITNMVIRSGWKLRLASLVALQNAGDPKLDTFHNRMIRWCQLRYNTLPYMVILEVLQEVFVCGAIGALAFWQLVGVHPLPFFLAHCLAFFIIDYVQLCVVHPEMCRVNKIEYGLAWIFHNCCSYLLMFRGLTRRTVDWRGHLFRIACCTGRITPLSPKIVKQTAAAALNLNGKEMFLGRTISSTKCSDKFSINVS